MFRLLQRLYLPIYHSRQKFGENVAPNGRIVKSVFIGMNSRHLFRITRFLQSFDHIGDTRTGNLTLFRLELMINVKEWYAGIKVLFTEVFSPRIVLKLPEGRRQRRI